MTEYKGQLLAVPYQHRYLNIFLIALITTSLLAGPVRVFGLITPSINSRLAIPVIFLVGLESGLTTWWLSGKGRPYNRLAYRAAELIFIIVAVRLASWLINEQALNTLSLQRYLMQPSTILDFPFVVLLVIAFFSWERGLAYTTIFQKLSISPAEANYYSTPTAERFRSNISTVVPKNRNSLYQDYLRAWLTGGIVLLFFVVVSTFDIPQAASNFRSGLGFLGIGRLTISPDMILALMLYFLGGLWLASLGRLQVLQARWLVNRSTSDVSIVKSWQKRSLFLLLLTAMIAALLPIGSTTAISQILTTILLFITYLSGIVMAIFALLLYVVSSIFTNDAATPVRQPVDLEQLFPQSTANPAGSDIASLIFGALFWIVIGAIVIFALFFLVRERGISVANRDQVGSAFQKLLTWLRSLFSTIGESATRVRDTLKLTLPVRLPNRQDIRQPWSFFRFGRLSPREQIWFLFLATVKRAGDRGVNRTPDMTAVEYSKKLIRQWPELETEVYIVTEAFQTARYSLERIDEQDVPPVQKAYFRFSKRIRQK